MDFFIIFLAIIVVVIVAHWKIYQKAGQPGWSSLIPIYNIVITLRIIKRPLWWIVLLFIPLINVMVGVIMLYDLAQSFGKGIGFAAGLLILPMIFYPILGFGDAVYTEPQRPVAASL